MKKITQLSPGYKLVNITSFLFLALSNKVFAIECTNDIGSKLEVINIGSSISVPASVPDGTVIWRGEPIQITAKCKSNGNHHEYDQVSLYINPAEVPVPSWNLELGLRYNGIDHYMDTPIRVENFIVPPCNSPSGCNDTQTSTFTVQPVIRKSGYPPQSSSDTYDIFQIDGMFGLDRFGNNYRLRLSGLSGINPTTCAVSASFSPDVIDFGSLPATGEGLSQHVRPFELVITQENNIPCGAAFELSGFISTNGTVASDAILPEPDSGFGIQLFTGLNNDIVPIEKVFKLTSFGENENQKRISFTASPVLLKAPLMPGEFNVDATLQISYN